MNNDIKLKRLEITRLFGYKDICIDFKDVTVLVGKNGLGKTTILKILNSLLTIDNGCRELSLCGDAKITFSDSEKSAIKYEYTDDFLEEFKQAYNIITRKFKTNGKKINSKEFYEKIANKLLFLEENNDSLIRGISPKKIYISESIDDFIKGCEIRYISTINMSANALRDITMSSGQDKNILNWELMIELKELAKEENFSYREKFIKQVSGLLKECNKRAEFDGDSFYARDFIRNAKINIEYLSSGERQLLYILSRVANTKDKPSFFLMDEPEISLHLNWQEKLIPTIKKLNPRCQIIIVTHSPAIVMDGFMDCYVDMDDISTVRTDV
ncbi:AAA family ATPase [Escherichia coli]